jgi:hypothetical protein
MTLTSSRGQAVDETVVLPHRPAMLPQLDASRNEIWSVLFRVADLAGGG